MTPNASRPPLPSASWESTGPAPGATTSPSALVSLGQLAAGDAGPRFSPDATKISFTEADGLHIASAPTAGPKRGVRARNDHLVIPAARHADWSPYTLPASPPASCHAAGAAMLRGRHAKMPATAAEPVCREQWRLRVQAAAEDSLRRQDRKEPQARSGSTTARCDTAQPSPATTGRRVGATRAAGRSFWFSCAWGHSGPLRSGCQREPAAARCCLCTCTAGRPSAPALLSARGALALWRMRSSAGTATGLGPDLWIVANPIAARSDGWMAKANVRIAASWRPMCRSCTT
jgi:hypothetical protein